MPTHDQQCHVAIIGAGPYGLAAAAHLRAAAFEARVYGEPMQFWDQHMPAGMMLRSGLCCSHIADPDGVLTLDQFWRAHQSPTTAPVPLSDFVAYGRWFQRNAVPDVDHRIVVRIERNGRGFELTLSDGAVHRALRVVVATGIGPFAWRPPQFDGLPAHLASHAFDRWDGHSFADQRVVVVGGGQSALESAALLHEAGAAVELIIRARAIRWLRQRPEPPAGAGLARLAYQLREVVRPWIRPDLDIMGPHLVSWLVASPAAFHGAPGPVQRLLTRAAVRPAGASWVAPRLAGVKVTTGRAVTEAIRTNAHLRLRVNDGSVRHVDHVLLATGYRPDVRRYRFLAAPLADGVRTLNGYPDLDGGFESSVPGLHFIGAPAAQRFGPICRFVVGTGPTARGLTRTLLERAGRAP